MKRLLAFVLALSAALGPASAWAQESMESGDDPPYQVEIEDEDPAEGGGNGGHSTGFPTKEAIERAIDAILEFFRADPETHHKYLQAFTGIDFVGTEYFGVWDYTDSAGAPRRVFGNEPITGVGAGAGVVRETGDATIGFPTGSDKYSQAQLEQMIVHEVDHVMEKRANYTATKDALETSAYTRDMEYMLAKYNTTARTGSYVDAQGNTVNTDFIKKDDAGNPVLKDGKPQVSTPIK